MNALKTLLALSLFLIVSLGRAEIRTFEFSGEANFVGNLTPEFQIGDVAVFSVTYDTAAAPTSVVDKETFYDAIAMSATVEGTSGPWTVIWDNPAISIFNDPAFQSINFYGSPPVFTAPPVDGQTLSIADVRLFSDNMPLPLENSDLPTDYTRTDWSSNPSSVGLFLFFQPGGAQDFARFSIVDMELVEVPEPHATPILLALLMACVAVKRRR